MNRYRLTLLTVLLCGFGVRAQASPADPGWPRHFSNGTADLVVYQPQVEAWSDFKRLAGRCAFALTPVRGREPVYGTFRFEGDTLVDPDQKVVLLRHIRAFDFRFPSAPGGTSAEWSDLARKLLPSSALVVSLDRLLAFVQAGQVPRQEARVRTDPPPIFVSTQPAVLVILDGDPVMLDVENTGLRRVLNTNWDLYQDRRTKFYYLRHQASWLVAADLHETFAPAAEMPADLGRLPAGDPRGAPAGPPPRVIVVKKPSELVVIRGTPELTLIASTQLSSVTNTESDLFFHSGSRSYYFLASGRWFRSSSLQGPWQYA